MDEWIGVKNRLPEIKDNLGDLESEDVLIIDSGNNQYVGKLTFYPKGDYRNEDKYSWDEKTTGCGCCCKSIDVIYWMPLPKPPEE